MQNARFQGFQQESVLIVNVGHEQLVQQVSSSCFGSLTTGRTQETWRRGVAGQWGTQFCDDYARRMLHWQNVCL